MCSLCEIELSTGRGGILLRIRGEKGERGGWERTVGIFPRILRLGGEDWDEGLRQKVLVFQYFGISCYWHGLGISFLEIRTHAKSLRFRK